MKGIIETSKGRFVVKDIPSIEEIEKQLMIFGHDEGLTERELNEYLISLFDNCTKYHKLSEITEEKASSIVDLFQLQYHKYKRIYQLYNLENINQKLNHTFSAIQSLHSLLESQGIEITNNTYIFKV